jgi:hypothetical protein
VEKVSHKCELLLIFQKTAQSNHLLGENSGHSGQQQAFKAEGHRFESIQKLSYRTIGTTNAFCDLFLKQKKYLL